MKKITLLLLGMLMITSASAEEPQYLPLVKDGKKWVEYYYNTIENTQSVTTYQFSGNIEIGGNIYSKLYATANTSDVTQEDVPIAYIREDDKQIYAIPINVEINDCVITNEDAGEYLIYNFNDITSPYIIDEDFMLPITTEQMSYGNNVVNLFILGNTKRIAVGIGCLDNVFYNPWPIILPDGSHSSLAWFEDNGEVIFRGDDYNAALEYLASQNEYVPLVREGVVWEYVGFRQNESSLPEKSLYTLEFNGTTTVDGKEYHNIYRTDYNEECIAQEPYLVACVREENKIVTVYINTDEANEYFYYTYWWWIPKTLYDFSKPMFLPDEASMAFGGESPYDYSTDYSSIEVEVGETVRKGYYIDNGNAEDSFKTLEGIGVDCNFGDLLIPYRTYSTGFNPMSALSAVYEDGELVYKGNAYDEAQGMKNPAAITTIAGERQEAGVRYYNLAGVESAEPQPGVNIRVTTYTDGTRKSEKIIR